MGLGRGNVFPVSYVASVGQRGSPRMLPYKKTKEDLDVEEVVEVLVKFIKYLNFVHQRFDILPHSYTR